MQEIQDVIEASNRQKTRDKKDRVEELFVLAEATANRVILGMSNNASDSDLVQPWHYYPDIFEDKTKEMEEQRELAETEIFKAKMSARAEVWNKRFEEEHK